MEDKNIKCISCWNKFDSNHSYTNLWFKKYECPECKQNFITELTTWYKIFYWILLLILIWTWINSIIEWWFPIIRLIFSVLIGLVFYMDFSVKKTWWKLVKKSWKKWLIVFWILISLWILMFIFQWDPVKFNEEQKRFIWNWKWNGIVLLIDADAYLSYEKEQESTSNSIRGPIVEFNENNFKAGIWFMKFNFKIDKKPYQDWNLWKMIIDWNELSRITNSYELKVPEIWELNKLTNDFFVLLNNSVYKGDYQTFYNWISKTWQAQTTPDKLKNILSPITEYKIDLEKIWNNEIIYNPPFLDENSLLILEWYYAGDIGLPFKLKYIYEYPNWKLVWFYFKKK